MVLQEKTDSTTYQSTYAFLPWEGMKNSDTILETRPHMGVGGGGEVDIPALLSSQPFPQGLCMGNRIPGLPQTKKKKKKSSYFFLWCD